ncbi:MAG TPA: NADH-quinone oxidoreductase subunit NuoK [Sphingobacteriaceae bacterium]|nr:NADH-quinone oxidoreductase subunit NuoK [Sphingobacteriaceae bacterium]
MIPLYYFLFLSTVLFSLGLWGALTRRNAVRVLLCIELMLNAVNINLVAFNRYLTPQLLTGQIFSIFVITIAAAEVAIGLAIVLMIVRRRGITDINKLNLLKG